ncbi:uncharacterized protein LACBIDRAFT_329807 [Laccaria bicolor S238N-H82]|uniref:Predicted protein n=1 Tax=Laccaria bicolor (strain S238N-H82 / ATCC MYA-4686) TaxID=486041 RepID=B0DJA7_LACBS|nr:uncharacterized protein LACBIDRAFT_329807 [Laccaria bicolor S238N-H82]EDR05489.1 predicted protein [Laccaria bicolor S238N-H82]|eukprot:XP_001884047.1 predicted protein [Laccaria bicolor S238N-H82]
MSLRNDDHETLQWHALTPGTILPTASGASNAHVSLLPSTAPSSAAIPIDPQLLHADFFPARKPGLLRKKTYKAHLTPDADFDVNHEALAKEYAVEGVAETVFEALDRADEELGDGDNLNDDAAQRTEANRRKGGSKTQRSIVMSWNVFQKEALALGKLQDNIVDGHALLILMDSNAERCKRNRQGEHIPNTRIEAIKELFWCTKAILLRLLPGLWSMITMSRFYTHHGEEHARSSRGTPILVDNDNEICWTERIWTDHFVYAIDWNSFMARCIQGWQTTFQSVRPFIVLVENVSDSYATGALLLHVLLLFFPVLPELFVISAALLFASMATSVLLVYCKEGLKTGGAPVAVLTSQDRIFDLL